MSAELILLLSALVKTAIQEGLIWSQGKTREEILARIDTEEAETKRLMDRMLNPDPE